MLSSITPVGEHARGQRWSVTTASYVVGSGLGGAATGALLGLLSLPVRSVLSTTAALAVLAVLALVGLVVDVRSLPRPSWPRQVDEAWLTTYRGWVYGLGFGLQLGSGVLTIITSSLTLVVLATMVLADGLAGATTIGAVFGLARALPTVAFATVRTPARLRSAFQGLERLRSPAETMARAALALTAGTAATLAVAG